MADENARDGKKSLLQTLAPHAGTLFTRGFRLQLAALCFRRNAGNGGIEILLITSRDTGRWVIPKGWPMEGKKPHRAAAIEAMQEAGVSGEVGKKPVGNYIYLKTLADGDVAPCMVDVYQIEVREQRNDFKEKGQRKLVWFTQDEAARRVREVQLKALIAEFVPR